MKPDSSGDSMELQEHLRELRNRMVRCLVYISIGAMVGWFAYDFMFQLFSTPIMPYLEQSGSKFLLTGIAEGFTFKIQMAIIAGIILSAPLVTAECWGFIRPGLTRQERRGVLLVAPLSILLFISGAIVSYYAIPVGIKWLINQNPPEAVFMPSVTAALLFIVKMVLAFGLVFEIPVVLIFLARIGIVDSRMLVKYWRQAVVGIAVVAAVATPSGDAMTMLVMCVPMLFLYLLSIGLVKLVQKKNTADKNSSSDQAEIH